MKKEIIAEGTPQEWIKYTPDGCGLFFVDEKMALEWERLSKARDALVDAFYKSEPLVSLNKQIAELMRKNEVCIKELSEIYRSKCKH